MKIDQTSFMKHCELCKEIFSLDANFCPKDGTTVTFMPINNVCPICHYSYEDANLYCTSKMAINFKLLLWMKKAILSSLKVRIGPLLIHPI